MQIAIALLVFLLAPLFCHASEVDHVARLQLLFPETVEGVTLADLPRVSPAWLRDKRDILRSAFLWRSRGKLVEDEGCSFITQALYNHDDLRLSDVSGDGIDDLLYVGTAHCLEGSRHRDLVWPEGQAWAMGSVGCKNPGVEGAAPACWRAARIGWNGAWLLRSSDDAILLGLPWQGRQSARAQLGRCCQADGVSQGRLGSAFARQST